MIAMNRRRTQGRTFHAKIDNNYSCNMHFAKEEKFIRILIHSMNTNENVLNRAANCKAHKTLCETIGVVTVPRCPVARMYCNIRRSLSIVSFALNLMFCI